MKTSEKAKAVSDGVWYNYYDTRIFVLEKYKYTITFEVVLCVLN